MVDDVVSKPKVDLVARGAAVNSLGILGKTLMPVFFVLATRLYGPDDMGIFYLCYAMIDVAIAVAVSGIKDGMVMFGSRAMGEDASIPDSFYKVLANCLGISLVIGILMFILANTLGLVLIPRYYSDPKILHAVRIMALAVPFTVFAGVVAAATRALFIMKWEALLFGLLQPLGFILFMGLFRVLGFGLDGLVWAYVLTFMFLGLAGGFIFRRYFSFPRLLRELRSFKLMGELVGFSIPQNLNMTFYTLIGNIDVLMLGWFGFPGAELAFYGMAAQIVKNIQQIRIVFSTAYAPMIARLHARGDGEEMNRSFTRVAQWTASLGLPTALMVTVLRGDLMKIFHGTFTGDTTFMLLLLTVPVMGFTMGIAGNIVVMTGHSRWNLGNTLLVTGLNVGLNWLLIPDNGMIGAAFSAAVSSIVLNLLQLFEARYLVNARMDFRQVGKPFIAVVPPALLVAAAEHFGVLDSLILRIAGALACLGLYLLMLRLQGLSPAGMLKARSSRS